MDNEIIYDVWIPYIDYEKRECDIKLKDGTIIKHVYPNAGIFNECCGKHRTFKEEDVSEIIYRKYFKEKLCGHPCNVDILDLIPKIGNNGSKFIYDTTKKEFVFEKDFILDTNYIFVYALNEKNAKRKLDNYFLNLFGKNNYK